MESQQNTIFNDLIKLVELAESVAEKRDIYKSKIEESYSIFFRLLFGIIMVGFASALVIKLFLTTQLTKNENYLILQYFSFFFISSMLAGVVYRLQHLLKTRREFSYLIFLEERNLEKLLETLSELKNIAISRHEITVIEQMLLEIRINRINFANR